MSYLIRNRVVVGLALSMCIGTVCTHAGGQEGEDPSEIARELKIMSKVLESSLDASGIEEWHAQYFGLSAFDSKIRTQYIPTVGAIFTLNINFPIVALFQSEDDEQPSAESDDLWEHFASGKDSDSLDAHPGRVIGIGVSIRNNDDGEIEILDVRPNTPASSAGLKKGDVILSVDDTPTTEIDIEEIAKRIQGPVDTSVELWVRPAAAASDDTAMKVALIRKEIRFAQPSIVPRLSRNQQIRAGVVWNEAQESDPLLSDLETLVVDGGRIRLNTTASYFVSDDRFRYDADKVKTLRAALLKAVAQYGHRITQLNSGERLLIIVNAPHESSAMRAVYLSGGNMHFSDTQDSDDRDRMLLAFDRNDLTESTTLAVMENAVTEQAY